MDNRKELFLHIGTGKTGTTALQEFFFSNRKKLSEFDIHYPEIGVQSCAHHLLSPHIPPFLKDRWTFIDPSIWAEEIFRMRGSRFLISSEIISSLPGNKVECFVSALRKFFDTKVIVYVRPQDEVFVAAYNQQVKAGTQLNSLSIMLKKQAVRFDYDRLLEPWAAALGRENIIVRRYGTSYFYRNDLRRDFLKSVFDLDSDKFDFPVGESNPRLCFAALNYKLLINNVFATIDERNEFNEVLLKFSLEQGGGQWGGIDGAMRELILGHYSKSNNAVVCKYFSPSRDALFKSREGNTAPAHDLLKPVKQNDIDRVADFIKKDSPVLYDCLSQAVRNVFCNNMFWAYNEAVLLRTSIERT